MRIATWNCARGHYGRKVPSLADLGVDIVALQEIGPPEDTSGSHVWQDFNPHQGVVVTAQGAFSVEPLKARSGVHPLTVPVQVLGPQEFALLAVWAHTAKGVTYVDAVLSAVDAYEDIIRGQPCVVAGDFNANAIWNLKRKTRPDFAALEQRLNDLGLVSSYHHFFGEPPGEETRPTHFFRWQEDQPFHLDYCFIPEAWLGRLRNVMVPDFKWGAGLSDHRPVVIELELEDDDGA